MSAITVSTCQAALVALLTAAQANTALFPDLTGIPIAREDYTDTTGATEAAWETALNGSQSSPNPPGMFLFVTLPFAVRVEQLNQGTARFLATIKVALFENPVANMNTENGGLGRDPLRALESVWRAVTNKPSHGPQQFTISDPLDQIQEISGGRIWVTYFDVPILWKP